MPKIRTEISIESCESLTVRRKRHSVRARCSRCRRVSIMVSPTEAAFLACQEINAIIALIYADKIHTRFFKKRGLYVCLTSLCLISFDDDLEAAALEGTGDPVELPGRRRTKNYSFIKEE